MKNEDDDLFNVVELAPYLKKKFPDLGDDLANIILQCLKDNIIESVNKN